MAATHNWPSCAGDGLSLKLILIMTVCVRAGTDSLATLNIDNQFVGSHGCTAPVNQLLQLLLSTTDHACILRSVAEFTCIQPPLNASDTLHTSIPFLTSNISAQCLSNNVARDS